MLGVDAERRFSPGLLLESRWLRNEANPGCGAKTPGMATSRLEALRLVLKAEPKTGLPRKSNQLAKPPWMRVAAATDPEVVANYQRLKNTVKDLKLASTSPTSKSGTTD